jgi:hypothetical protein
MFDLNTLKLEAKETSDQINQFGTCDLVINGLSKTVDVVLWPAGKKYRFDLIANGLKDKSGGSVVVQATLWKTKDLFWKFKQDVAYGNNSYRFCPPVNPEDIVL